MEEPTGETLEQPVVQQVKLEKEPEDVRVTDLITVVQSHLEAGFDHKKKETEEDYEIKIAQLQFEKEAKLKAIDETKAFYLNYTGKLLPGFDGESLRNSRFLEPFLRSVLKNAPETLTSSFKTIPDTDSSSLFDYKNSNYLTISGDFVSKSELKLGNDNTISDERLDWRSRALQVSDHELLITGGSNFTQVLLLNTETKVLERLHDLKIGRELHATAWLDHKPSVIGGSDENHLALDSVEVYSLDSWNSVPSLNKKRYGLSATSLNERVWVAGGAEDHSAGVIEIEYYYAGQWKLIDAKLDSGLVGIGLVSSNNYIYLLGGLSSSGNNTDGVFRLNTDNHNIDQLDSLDSIASFSQNLWKLNGKKFEGVTFKGSFIQYALE
jgi:hypothetical protein